MSIGGGGGRQQLEQLSEQIEEIEQQKEQLQANIQDIREEKTEIDEAIEGLGLLETGSTVQVPVGGGAYVRATVDDIEEVVVDLGAGYAAEEERDDAVETLEHKKENLDDRIEEVQETISELDDESAELEAEAQQAQQQLLQQLQSQQGGGE